MPSPPLVNQALPEGQRGRVQDSQERGHPPGDEQWTLKAAQEFRLQYTPNPRGRQPKKRRQPEK
jgi:hypothetical protein